MPVTRSQKGSSREQAPENTEAIAAGTQAQQSGSGTTEFTSYETTMTGTTRDTTTTSQGHEDKEASTVRRNRPASVKSQRRRKELEARAELAEKELREAQAATVAARLRLEVIQAENEEDEDSIIEEPLDRVDHVREWVQQSAEGFSKKGHEGEASKEGCIGIPPPSADKPDTKADMDKSHRNLARAIAEEMKSVHIQGQVLQPDYMHQLPFFDGDSREWMAFKAVYEDTAPLFSDVQNMARLRRALKGEAREGVRSQLYSESTPGEVMEALKRCYGRADALVLAELDRIRKLPPISDNPYDVCLLASNVNNTVAAIRGLRKPQYLQSPEILRSIADKMPAILKYRWYDYVADKAEGDPDLNLMARFLNKMADRCGPHATPEAATRKQIPRRQAAHTTTDHIKEERPGIEKQGIDQGGREKTACPHCREGHFLHECPKFRQAPVKNRWNIAKESRLCYKCLSGRHRKETCRHPPCPTCKRWHHSLLHEERREETKQEKEVANNVRLPVNCTRSSRAYLKMIPVEVYGPAGEARVLALLDEGSTVTLLDSTVAEQVGLEGPKETLHLETVGGQSMVKKDSMKLNMQIRGLHQSKKRTVTGARTIDDMNLTPQRLEKSTIENCAHLKKLMKQLHYEEDSPKLLIGQDNWELIISRATRKGKKNQPVASFTQLGWVLHGFDGGTSRPVNFVTCAHVSAREEALEKLMKDHFAVESLGVLPKLPSTDQDQRALDILEKTSRRLEDGRFEVGLLWKNDEEELPDNFKAAEVRLHGILKKLHRDPELKKEYENQIENLVNNGYAEEADQDTTSRRKWYLPHFAVTHPTKKKKRLVFDAAAKTGGKSLNDLLLSGPDLLQSLFGVLLRFRQKPIAVVADIKEMFLQIRIREEDRDSLRFLWKGEQASGPIKEYRMTSVIFGAACSPSAAIFVKNKNAAEYQDQFPEAARAVEHNHYMDDYLQSFDTDDEATKIANEVDIIHKKAKFELRGWASNSPSVLRSLTKETGQMEIDLGPKEEKTLGLRWYTEDDELGFRTCLGKFKEDVQQRRGPTKREVTSAVMATFDPMGVASPVLIQGKVLIQNIWRSGIDWDEEVTASDQEAWREYLANVQVLETLRIPRCFTHSSDEGELHTFTDASETAYACAVYYRVRKEDGGYHVALLAAKARVTPLKPVSIPRLELQAALLGTRMTRTVEEELDLKIKKRTYWTDSSTVLSWIKSDPRTFKPFVAHRLAEIEDLSKPQEWRWVPTSQNPADDATRGVPRDFGKDHRWFNGPAFLRLEETGWPEPRTFKAEPTGEEKEKHTVGVTRTPGEQLPTPEPDRFSSWTRLWRATARVLQFIDLCRKRKELTCISRKMEKQDPTWRRAKKKKLKNIVKPTTSKQREKFLPIDKTYLERAEKLLLKRSQDESFGSSTTSDRQGRLKKLDIIEEDGLLRVKGRIDAATFMERAYRRPVILDGKHKITRLLIHHYHAAFNHGNHATVINEVRQRYWVLGLRSTVRTVAHQCQWCKVYRSAPHTPPTGNLPKERLRFGEPPFTCTAVDYFGPMTVTVGRRHEKRWGALFTCLTTRAVHLELTASLSTDSMILALRRMAARRGMPKVIYSDNGTNFVGSNKELEEAAKDLRTEDFATAAGKIGVQWKFIPPGAPNMGGAWERLVRSVKSALAVTLKERCPQEETLHTLLLEAEHIVNSRPLVATEENENEEALTPNHFLIGRSCGSPRIGSFTDEDLAGRRTWRVAQRMADHFWSRWLKEYLPTLLTRRVNGGTSNRDLQCGDTVLIVDSTLPRNTWPRGVVTQTHPGPDGRIRIVEVRTAGGTLKRPSSKVVLLVPATSDEQRDAGSGQPSAMSP